MAVPLPGALASPSFKRFGEIGCALHSQEDVQGILDFLVENTADGAGACGGLLRFTDTQTEELTWHVACGRGRLVSASSHALWEATIPRNVPASVRVVPENQPAGIRQLLGVPLGLGEDQEGTLLLLFDAPRAFTEHELEFVTCTATLGVCAAENAHRAARQRSRYDQLAFHTEKLSALGRMAAGIAHEINNPLAGILLYSTNLVKKVPGDGQVRDGLQVIIDETIRCRGIIQELLEFSRERIPRRVRSSINAILEKAVLILENELHLQHVHLEVKLASGLPDLSLDPSQLEQVFVNLLLNALEALEGQGVIGVKTVFDAGRVPRVRVEVTDSGRGIPEAHLGKIFEPFFSTKEKGTGLGLAVSYGIVRNHGGDLRVQNRSEGGTRFTVELPVEGEFFPEPKRG